MNNEYDSIIIGFGKGGKTLAVELANHGESVAVIEKSKKMYGGTCPNVACLPTKSLVHDAKIATYATDGSFSEKELQFQAAMGHKNQLTSRQRSSNYKKLDDFENITIYDGLASFVSSHEIEVSGDRGSIILTGKKIFINTGAEPVVPAIHGVLESKRTYFSEGMLDIAGLPRRLIIIGGGYIGLEFASFFTNFGSQVTILQDGPRFLPREDEDIAASIRNVLEGKGVVIETNVLIHDIVDTRLETHVSATQEGVRKIFAGDAVLVATGRRPNVEALHLENAGIELTERKAIKVDEHLRTNVENVWAIGDVTGGLQFTYISLDDYRIISSQLYGDGSYTTKKRNNVPYSVFIDPSFSRVGLNEDQARAAGYEIKIAKIPAMTIPKAQVLRETSGLLKAIVDAKTDRILGVMLFCEESYEMINIVKLAMDAGLPYTVLRDQVFTHPTMSEGLNLLFTAIH